MYAASASSIPVGISLTVLVLFLAFLLGLAWLLVRLVSNARKDGSGAYSGCLLATGFGALSVVLAGIAFGCAVTVVALTLGPETLHQYERHWGIGHARADSNARSARASNSSDRAAGATDLERADAPAAALHAELDAALAETRGAYEEALREAREAGHEVQGGLREALREAAAALREAREAARDARREAAQAFGSALDEARASSNRSMPEDRNTTAATLQLRFDVRGDPGPQLARLVERLCGEPVQLAVARSNPDTQEAQWIFALAHRSPQDVSRLEDEIRAALAVESFPDGSQVEFRDVVLQDEQRHAAH